MFDKFNMQTYEQIFNSNPVSTLNQVYHVFSKMQNALLQAYLVTTMTDNYKHIWSNPIKIKVLFERYLLTDYKGT